MTTEQALLLEKLDEVKSMISKLDTTLMAFCNETDTMKMSLGVKPQDEWFNLITDTNNKAIKQRYDF